jgi:ABC-type glycerol-3-phosphate transport system substrate-binding protein
MKPKILLCLLAVATLPAAGCGGASDDSSGSADAAASGGSRHTSSLSLVAYSTPEVVYDEVIPGFQATPTGKGVGF